jgi:hypothetical protein
VRSVVNGLATVAIVVALIAALAAAGYAALNRVPDRVLYAALCIVELVLLVQAVAGGVLLTRGDGPDQSEDIATFIGYLLTSVLALPAGAAWAHSERTRSGTAVLAVVCLVVPVLIVRAKQVWSGVDV